MLVIDVRCIYYILYYILLYIILYLILYSSQSPLLSSPPSSFLLSLPYLPSFQYSDLLSCSSFTIIPLLLLSIPIFPISFPIFILYVSVLPYTYLYSSNIPPNNPILYNPQFSSLLILFQSSPSQYPFLFSSSCSTPPHSFKVYVSGLPYVYLYSRTI